MSFVIGIDPGKEGGIVVLDPHGEIFFSAVIPYENKQTAHEGLSQIFWEIDSLIRQYASENGEDGLHGAKCYIERIYTRPEDSGSESYLKALEEVAKIGADMSEGDMRLKEMAKALETARKYYHVRDRKDGRVGIMNYAKSTGILFMGAMLEWEIHEVDPKTWGAVIKKGAPTGLNSKEKSMWALALRDQSLMEKPSPLFRTQRSRSVCMGLAEASA